MENVDQTNIAVTIEIRIQGILDVSVDCLLQEKTSLIPVASVTRR